jgi:protease YdgD
MSVRRAAAAALTALNLLAMSVAPALSQARAGLETMTMRDDLLGWEAVGRVWVNGESFCTGTLVATDLVLTAAHCVFSGSSADLLPAEAFEFHAGPRDSDAVATRRVRAVAVDPAYVAGTATSPQTIRADVALLQLSEPIPAAAAAPFAVTSLASGVRSVTVVSLAQGREDALSIERGCRVTGRGGGLFGFDCDVTFGSSGAPVFDVSGGRGRIISIISAGNADEAYGMDVVSSVTTLTKAIRDGRPSVRAVETAQNTLVSKGLTRAGGAKFVKP